MSRTNVLFMQSQTYFGADSKIHSLLMKHLDRGVFNVHAAVNIGTREEPSASLAALRQIPNLHLRPTHFGASINYRSRDQILRDTMEGMVPAIGSLAGLVAYTRKHKIDLIHCTEKPRDAFYGLVLARLTGAVCLVHLHVGVDLSWMNPLTQIAMRFADGLIGVSAFVSKTAERAGWLHKVHTLLNALEPSEWDYNLDSSGIRREFGIAPDMPLLATVSRLCPWKGQHDLIRALALVKEQGADFRLLVVGEDDIRATPGGGSYTAQLKQLTGELGLDEQIIFTGFRRDIPQIMSASDIYAMPSFEEPFGMVFLEAMAMKRPVVALVSGGVPEFVEHGKSGMLSVHQDIDTLAANILTLVRDKELCQRMGEHGRRRVEERFNAATMTREVEQIYRLVLQARGRAPRIAAALRPTKQA